MEQGTITQFAGCSLDDIDVTGEDVLPLGEEAEEDEGAAEPESSHLEFRRGADNSTPDAEDMEANHPTSNSSPGFPTATDEGSCQISISSGAKVKLKTCTVQRRRRSWAAQEQEGITQHFREQACAREKRSKHCIKKEPALQNRTWKNVKDFVRNAIVKK